MLPVIALIASPLSTPTPARANVDKPSKSLSVHLGPKGEAFDVLLLGDGVRSPAIQVGRRRLSLPSWPRHRPAQKSPALTSAEDLELSSGDHIAILHGTDDEGHPQAIVVGLDNAGQPTLLWHGDQSPHGDPGERTQQVLRTATEGGGLALYAGLTYEQARLCGQSALPLLNGVRIAPKGSRPPAPHVRTPTGAQVPFTVTSSAQVDPSTLHLLTAQGTSNGDRTLGPNPPFEAVDGDVTTGWSSGEAHGGAGQFLTFTFQAHGLPLRTLAVRFGSDTPAPTTLRAYVQGGVMEISVPADLSEERPWMVVLPQVPIATACVSLEVAAAAPGGGEVRVVEVRALSPFDGPEAPKALVHALEQGEHANAAAQILAQSGPQVLPPLIQAWPALGLPARVRAMPTLLRYAQKPEVYPLLAEALQTVDPAPPAPFSAGSSLRELAMRGLATRPQGALSFLQWQLKEHAAPDGELALSLAQRAPDGLSSLVLSGLSTAPAGPGQTQLARACARLLNGKGEALDAVQSFVQGSPPPIAAAKLAIALSRQQVTGSPLDPLVERALMANDDFEAQYWAVQAAPLSPHRPDAREFLARVAREQPAWMLRDAALAGLASVDPTGSLGILQEALDDPYPRVRARAIRILGPTGQPLRRLLKHLSHDRWHLVRIAAVESVGDHPQLRAALREQIADPVRDVRVSVIRRLTSLRDVAAWPAVQARMALDSEALEVKLASVEYTAELCIEPAKDRLQAYLDAGLSPGASEMSRELAVAATGALWRLGQTDWVTTRLERVPETGLRTALQRALNGSQPCPR